MERKIERVIQGVGEVTVEDLIACSPALDPATAAIRKKMEKEKRRKEWEMKNAQKQEEQTKVKAGDVNESRAYLRAKRRELQEAQRLAKQQASGKTDAEGRCYKVKVEVKIENAPEKPSTETKKDPETKTKKDSKIKKEMKKSPSVSKVQLVHHLYVEEAKRSDFEKSMVNIKGVHPAFITLGAQYKFNTILGSNARCLALLSALKSLIEDLTTPPKQEFCRYLESTIQYCAAYLQICRPFAVSMTNALRHFKLHLRQVDTNLPDTVKKTKLLDVIDNYIQDEIAKADEAISMKVTEKIENMDVILTYGW